MYPGDGPSLGRALPPRPLDVVAEEYGVRAFCLGGNRKAAAMAARYLAVLDGITPACAEPGPFVYAVSAGGCGASICRSEGRSAGTPPSRD